MPVVELADSTYALEGAFVTDMAAQRVGRVGGIHNDSPLPDNIGRLPYQPELRIVRVYLKKLAHIEKDRLIDACSAPLAVLLYNARPK
jgi:hypothetical protein